MDERMILSSIRNQVGYVRKLGQEPNRIILGERVFYALHNFMDNLIMSYNHIPYLSGVPVTVDYDDRYRISVCVEYVLEIKEVLDSGRKTIEN